MQKFSKFEYNKSLDFLRKLRHHDEGNDLIDLDAHKNKNSFGKDGFYVDEDWPTPWFFRTW